MNALYWPVQLKFFSPLLSLTQLKFAITSYELM